MNAEYRRFDTAEAAADACCTHVVAMLEEALDVNRRATLAVSGGSTPRLLFPRLAAARLDWKNVHLFWADERMVPPTDAESNFRLAQEHLITPAKLPARNIHRVPSDVDPPVAAKLYSNEIREFFSVEDGDLPRFDVVQLGMGPDGHTASLFPGDPLLEDRERFAAAVRGPKPPHQRITLLPGVLLAARNALFLVSGEDKAQMVRDVFNGPDQALQLPAQLITRRGRKVLWFLDASAASLLDE